MKILVLLAVLANVVVFMWEFRYGASDRGLKTSQQHEPIVLVNELKTDQPVLDTDFTSLYPPGLDPRSDNLLTEQPALADF